MNKEIKEILDYLKESATKQNLYFEINPEKAKKLLDYITNLQEENQALKNQLDFIEEQNHIIDKLQEKIDKAIEYIKSCNNKEKLESMFLDENYISNYGAKDLLNILTGGDEEWKQKKCLKN